MGKSFQILLDVLKGYGFDSIEADIKRRDTEVSESLTLMNILTEKELNAILDAKHQYELPRPQGRAHAIYLNKVRYSLRLFSSHAKFDSNQLDNLSSTLREIGIQDKTIHEKLRSARDLAIRYER